MAGSDVPDAVARKIGQLLAAAGRRFQVIGAEGQVGQAASVPLEEAKNGMVRQELIAKFVSTMVGLAASFAITYFGVKYIVNAMDPTRKEKKSSQMRVSLKWHEEVKSEV